jgi:hypothetical protein
LLLLHGSSGSVVLVLADVHVLLLVGEDDAIVCSEFIVASQVNEVASEDIVDDASDHVLDGLVHVLDGYNLFLFEVIVVPLHSEAVSIDVLDAADLRAAPPLGRHVAGRALVPTAAGAMLYSKTFNSTFQVLPRVRVKGSNGVINF